MDTLKVCISWVITSFYQSFKTSLHQCTNTTAKNSLLTKEVSLCLCTESCLQNAGSCTTNCKGVSKCKLQSFSCCILMYCYQTRNTFSCLILAAYRMSRSFWCNHRYINVSRWNNLVKVNIETMSKHKHIACFQVWLNGLFVHFCLQLIIDKNHDDISFFSSFGCRIYFKSLLFCSLP